MSRRDREADLDAWVLATAPRAVAFAISMLRDLHQAEDIVQDCYCRLLQKADSYDLPNDGLKLLLAAITNACINLRTRHKPMLSLTETNGDGEELATDPIDPKAILPEQQALGHELADALAVALGQLPSNQQAAVELKSLGYSQQEIAAMLGIGVSNAGVLVHRARLALAKQLAQYLGEEKVT